MAKKYRKQAQKILNNFEELSTFRIDLDDLELDDFSFLFDDIHDMCLSPFELEDEENEISEDTFRNFIQKSFFNVQTYSNQ